MADLPDWTQRIQTQAVTSTGPVLIQAGDVSGTDYEIVHALAGKIVVVQAVVSAPYALVSGLELRDWVAVRLYDDVTLDDLGIAAISPGAPYAAFVIPPGGFVTAAGSGVNARARGRDGVGIQQLYVLAHYYRIES